MEIDGEEQLASGFTKLSAQLLDQLVQSIKKLQYDTGSVSADAIVKLVNDFETSPSLLDAKLPQIVEALTTAYQSKPSIETSDIVGVVTYNLAKVRGFKIVANHFPTNVYLVPQLLDLLADLTENEVFFQLLWLSNLVLVPFPLKRDMIDRFFLIGLSQLKKYANGSKNQLCSLILLSRFLSRPDLCEYLGTYFDTLFTSWYGMEDSEKLGHLMVINKLLKNGLTIHNYVLEIYRVLIQDELISVKVLNTNNMNLLYVIKILCKMGENFIKLKNYSMVQKILNDLIDIQKHYSESLETTLRYCLAKSLSKMSVSLSSLVNYHHQVIVYLLSQLDIELSILPVENYNNPTVNQFADVAIDFDRVSVFKFHTILLYLGYLVLHRSLPLYLYPTILSIVHKSLFIRQHRMTLNLANQIKDSSCFVLWSVARSLDKHSYELLSKNNTHMFSQIMVDLLEVTLLDKDLTIRRCGVAVLQEFMGRVGDCVLKSDNPIHKGEKIIKFVELFSSYSVRTKSEALNLVDQLISIGIDKSIILELLVRNIVLEDSFEHQKVISKKLNEIWSMESTSELDIGYSSHFEGNLLKLFSGLDHSLYLLSEFTFSHPEAGYQDYLSSYKFRDDLVIDFIELAKNDASVGHAPSTDLLEQIIRSRRNVGEKLAELFMVMSQHQDSVPVNLFNVFLEYFNVSLSQSVFYLHNLSASQIHDLVEIMHSSRIDYEIRYNLVDCLRKNYKQHRHKCDFASEMLVLLNDYTITEQGDVGSKVRNSMLEFASTYQSEFDPVILTEHLLRISGEPIQRLRLKSFALLMQLNGTTVDISSITDDQYYQHLFAFYKENELTVDQKQEFMRGIIQSIGGLTGDSGNIQDSFRQFYAYIIELKYDERKSVFREVFKLLTKKKVELQKTLKEYLNGLNLMIKVFESNIAVPQEFIGPLYVKVHNLQVNCSSITRINLTITLMLWLIIQDQDMHVKETAFKRLMLLLKTHKSELVKNYILQALYQVALELEQDYKPLETVDITQPEQIESLNHLLYPIFVTNSQS